MLLPVAVAVYRREFLTPVLLVVTAYFLVRFLEECVFLYYVLIPKSTQRISNLALILDSLLIGWFYWLSFARNSFAGKLTIAVTTLVFVATTSSYSLDGLGSVSHSCIRLMIIILSLVYFNKILSENRVRKIVSHSLFWVNAGFLFFGMGTFMTSLFKDYLLDPALTTKETYNLFSDMNQILSMILSALVAIGMWVSDSDKDNYIQSI
ncbi:hypothetical protein [Fibrella forsythiae]|uniref:Uncharacterized protein n=1 Tax=Fibrella forsythiae TaxID=2817061 RepID=A0ABS3JFJ1_9BACT|nr:hypothetical protein [Fibrella forsythiae]MBO0948769.1 hypothetical protein [Fibrella forsythiae]